MYTANNPTKIKMDDLNVDFDMDSLKSDLPTISSNSSELLLKEALMACNELGFKEAQILPIARKILNETSVLKAEQLVHLVLKQIG
jgi:Holliday junction resolvasome RuvABC DNA-binding subunit